MPSIFSRIINREIPAHIVAEDDRYIAFLDISPLVIGHVLIVPKQEIDYIFDMDDEGLAGLMVFAKKVSHAVKAAVSCTRIGVSIIGLEVPHTHVHLVPMNSADDVNFTRAKLAPENEELVMVAEKIRSFIK